MDYLVNPSDSVDIYSSPTGPSKCKLDISTYFEEIPPNQQVAFFAKIVEITTSYSQTQYAREKLQIFAFESLCANRNDEAKDILFKMALGLKGEEYYWFIAEDAIVKDKFNYSPLWQLLLRFDLSDIEIISYIKEFLINYPRVLGKIRFSKLRLAVKNIGNEKKESLKIL